MEDPIITLHPRIDEWIPEHLAIFMTSDSRETERRPSTCSSPEIKNSCTSFDDSLNFDNTIRNVCVLIVITKRTCLTIIVNECHDKEFGRNCSIRSKHELSKSVIVID